MTTGQDLFVELVRAKERREDQTVEIKRLRGALQMVRDLLEGQNNAVAASLRAICDHELLSD